MVIRPNCLTNTQAGLKIIKLFMFNSTGHEIFSADKYENANNSWQQ